MMGVVSSERLLPALNIGAKLLLVALLVYATTHLEFDQFRGKAMTARAVFYPVSIVVIPIVWALRGRPKPYPHLADLFLAMPFIIDVSGNALDLYNSVVWFDDVAHVVTWMFLVLAVGFLILRLGLEAWLTAALLIGFGAATHVLWEIIEFVAMEIGAPGLQLTYKDTIMDLALSLCGSTIAGLIAGWRAESMRREGSR